MQKITFRHFTTDFLAGISGKKTALSGVLTALFWGIIHSSKVAFAKDFLEHAIEEIMNHTIWETVGHFTGIGKAATFLGALLFFPELGEKDIVYIPKAPSKPMASYDINPATKKLEQCVILENGKKLFGKEIIDFYKSLMFVQFLPNYKK